MSGVWHLLTTALLALQSAVGALVGYLLLLTAAAGRAPRRTPFPPAPPPERHRFAVLIPAHDEALLLPDLLASLRALDYPAALVTVHVIADNCRDDTAAVARRAGVVVHERVDPHRRGKPYALRWGLERLWAAENPDAVVIVDADSVVSADFLRIMDARLARGERVIQAYYTVRHPERSFSTGMRYVALAALHYLRPQGRAVLGGSAGLKGNGMVFAADVLRRYTWSTDVTEDIDFHMQLLLGGERVTFAPDAVVAAEMPETLDGARSQNERWEQGRLALARRYVPTLLRRAAQAWRAGDRRRAGLLVDAALEHVVPPLTALLALAGLLGSAGAAGALLRRGPVGGRRANVGLALFNVGGVALYVLAGLRLARAPQAIYRLLLGAPRYVLWKLGLLWRVAQRPAATEWVRTARNRPPAAVNGHGSVDGRAVSAEK